MKRSSDAKSIFSTWRKNSATSPTSLSHQGSVTRHILPKPGCGRGWRCRDREGGCRLRRRLSGSWSGPGLQRVAQAGRLRLRQRGPLDLDAPRLGELQGPPESSRSQGRGGRHHPDRGSGSGVGEEEARRRGLRSRLRITPSRRPGHLLCRHPEGRWPDLSADLHRHLRQDRSGQTLHHQSPDHGG